MKLLKCKKKKKKKKKKPTKKQTNKASQQHYTTFTRVHLSTLKPIRTLITLHNYISISVIRVLIVSNIIEFKKGVI